MSNLACDKWPNGGPNPTRTWTRAEGDVCSGTAEIRALEKKIEVLQYKNNSAHLTKKQKWAQLAKGKSHNKKQSWATQTQTYTNPNVNNLLQPGPFSLCCGVKDYPECCSITNISLSSIATEFPANTFTLNGPLTIDACSILAIDAGITFIFNGTGVINNGGRIINNGTFTNNVVFSNGINNSNGIITNNGTFNNNGYVNNFSGKINNSGTFNNNNGGAIDNQGLLSCWSGNAAISNGGSFNPNLPEFYPGAGCA